jgi:hypothetical protein
LQSLANKNDGVVIIFLTKTFTYTRIETVQITTKTGGQADGKADAKVDDER